MKKYNFLNINPYYDCVKISHAFALHLSSVSKQCFLVGESRYQSYVYFQALKIHCFAKIMFFLENLIVNTY